MTNYRIERKGSARALQISAGGTGDYSAARVFTAPPSGTQTTPAAGDCPAHRMHASNSARCYPGATARHFLETTMQANTIQTEADAERFDALLYATHAALITLGETANALREEAAREGRHYCLEAERLRVAYEPLQRAFWAAGGEQVGNLPLVTWGGLAPRGADDSDICF